ncbi:glycosyl hydrolase family 28 protein [Chitinophaga horti]|uniref:Glycosyl hydrolase family 28 protein n=1 Tax=Chitinophaga horti TaxID=2920382 RepID=A0ABY6J5C0_9BACT|nr:glycosyl hydrolase family 28 protein [Chitinophaga horti]UYQ94880.1 glycosyl hydrolase family 28 protein [Chitinophaga horti]
MEKLVASGGLVSDDNRTWYPSEKSKKGTGVKNAGVISPDKTAKDYEEIKDFLRPNMVVLTRCKKVLLQGVTFQNSPAWCLHPLLCEHITLRDVYVKNPWYAQNGDGVDLESCRFGRVENCVFDVGDDAICIKSGRDEQGRKRGVPTENFIIKNNLVYHAHGGFVIGSEMSGGARNLFVSNCTFMGTDIGLRFKTTRGRGGVVEKIFIKDINMTNIPGEAILFDMYYMAKDPVPLAGEKAADVKVETIPVTEATPQFRDFQISNVVCHGAQKGIFIRGLPEMPISNITMDNIVIKAKKGAELLEASNIRITNATFEVTDSDPLINVRNSREIQLSNIKFDEAKNFINIKGEKSGVVVSGTDIKKAKDKPVFADGATAGALTTK